MKKSRLRWRQHAVIRGHCTLLVVSKSDSDGSGPQGHVTIVKERLRHDKLISVLIKCVFGIQDSGPFVGDVTDTQIDFGDRVGICEVRRGCAGSGAKWETIWHGVGVRKIHSPEQLIATLHGISELKVT